MDQNLYPNDYDTDNQGMADLDKNSGERQTPVPSEPYGQPGQTPSYGQPGQIPPYGQPGQIPPYGQQAGTGQQGANMQQPRGVYSGYIPLTSGTAASTALPKKTKHTGKAAAFWKKALAAAMVGIIFGIFAAGSFYAANYAAEIAFGSIKTQEEAPAAVLETKDALETEDVQEIAAALANQKVTTVVTDVTDVVEKVMPSAVSITNSYKAVGQNFFGQTYEYEDEGSGSGIIVGQNDTELLIATNSHVIAGADSLVVQFIDGETAGAQLKGNDATMDLAVIAVSLDEVSETTLNSIRIAQMGDSASVKIGEPAIAIGNSLGYGQSVTTGVISAVGRELNVGGETYGAKLIQTDAAINPGNSGGALVNINGEVIGINSAKIEDTIIEGMGYAIPISEAKPIINTLMSKETRTKVSDDMRGYLGIRGANITNEITEVYDGIPKGIYVVVVTRGSGAEAAGIVKGNIITKLDGVSVAKIEELNNMLSYYKAGDTVTLTIVEGNPAGYQEKEVTVTLSGKEAVFGQE